MVVRGGRVIGSRISQEEEFGTFPHMREGATEDPDAGVWGGGKMYVMINSAFLNEPSSRNVK